MGEPGCTEMIDQSPPAARLRWARFRFGVVAPLLTAPPERGELSAALAELSARSWVHPTTGEPLRLSRKTIERWYYAVRDAEQPIEVLARKVPRHAGTHPSVSEPLVGVLRQLRADHPRWSAQLLYDNARVLSETTPELNEVPSYATVCRYLRSAGLGKARKPRRHEKEPGFAARERRSYEVAHVHALWHTDFHEGKRKVALPSGRLVKPTLFALLDDRSRLCCHAQWYADEENSEIFVHGLTQGFQKRKLPRSLLSDNGSAMLAAEVREGLGRLSVAHHTTLSESPEQNGKQEFFWTQVEGRLMAMLEGEPALTLELLNRATQAWVEQEYHRRVHGETGQTPLERWLEGPSVGRPCPSSDELRRAFRMEVTRQQRKSDGTLTFAGVRYELPSVYRTLERASVRVARWDLSSIDLVDPHRGTHLCTLWPLDKERNADRRRRTLARPSMAGEAGLPSEPAAVGIAPLLQRLMADYAATGLPPAYVHHDPSRHDDDES